MDVEVKDEYEANETIAGAADVVMLDNIEGSEFASVACRLRER
jgi:nicotinate-nucleotide pyrophosphorylase